MSGSKALVLGWVGLLASCGSGTDWVAIQGASASSPGDTVVELVLQICRADPPEIPASAVSESDDEIRVLIPFEHSDEDEAGCLGVFPIVLGAPVGDRVVVDDRTGFIVTVQFNG
jgi:hypothetical protein